MAPVEKDMITKVVDRGEILNLGHVFRPPGSPLGDTGVGKDIDIEKDMITKVVGRGEILNLGHDPRPPAPLLGEIRGVQNTNFLNMAPIEKDMITKVVGRGEIIKLG